ncbi:LysE family translocator [Halobaculum sp. CBA1158]|uniref:LysE family transporter n=1 Tax=Halobaculum sp. CBA1158 TaxID=2904243 RepID=UPI001F248150|nr:LysE family transporter [Halobaculum sp. CBA1158]UIP00684.1 LysE family translocator [Halobaculum sp. CBA1158]
MTVAASLVAGVAFGLALAAPPGPMNAVIAEESVLRGWTAGVRAGLGAATADAIFLVLAVVGAVGVVNRVPLLRGVMVGIGGLLMLYYAYGAATAVRESFLGVDTGLAEEDSAGFRKALTLALANPYQVLFWLTVGVGLLEPGRIDVFAAAEVPALAGRLVVETGSPALIVGFFAGIGLWITGFPGALVAARSRVESLAPVVAVGSALLLAGFGVAFLLDAARTLGPVV